MNKVKYALELKGNKLFIDNSSLGNITSCFRKGFFNNLCKRRENKSRMALFFGSAIHKALEVRAKSHKPMLDLETEKAMITSLVEHYQGCEDVDDFRNLNYAVQTIVKYNDVYKFDPLQPIKVSENDSAVELPFALHIGDIDVNDMLLVSDPDVNNGKPGYVYLNQIEIWFMGKIDRVVESRGGNWVLDHKTTSIGGPTFYQDFFVSHQFRGYKWACEQLGYKIDGVIIDALICRPPKKDGTTNYEFDRQYIEISDEHVSSDWLNSFMAIVAMFLGCYRGTEMDKFKETVERFPMFTTSCVTKYGVCEYHQVCCLNCGHREDILGSTLYEDNTWNPINSQDQNKPKVDDFHIPGLVL